MLSTVLGAALWFNRFGVPWGLSLLLDEMMDAHAWLTRRISSSAGTKLLATLWLVWYRRNNVVFDNSPLELQEIQWNSCNPCGERIKINTNGSCLIQLGYIGRVLECASKWSNEMDLWFLIYGFVGDFGIYYRRNSWESNKIYHRALMN